MKIVEQPGRKLFDVLKMQEKKEPRVKCIDDDRCMICTCGKGNCKTDEPVYDIECLSCHHHYIGESARNGKSRSIEHVTKSRSKNQNVLAKSFIHQHILNEHSHCDNDGQVGEEVTMPMNN